jgi:hypothetical protein
MLFVNTGHCSFYMMVNFNTLLFQSKINDYFSHKNLCLLNTFFHLFLVEMLDNLITYIECGGTRLCIRSCLLRELTASQLVAIATRSDTGSHKPSLVKFH